MGNKRVFYACQGILYNGNPVEGVQNLTLNTQQEYLTVDNFGSYDAFHVADHPKISINLTRVISNGGTALYSGALKDNINNHTNYICLFIGDDTKPHISGATAPKNIYLENVSINSVGYSLSVDGNLTEQIGFIGFHRENNGCPTGIEAFNDLANGGNVMRRQHYQSGLINDQLISFDVSVDFGIEDVKEFGKNFTDQSVGPYRYARTPITVSTRVEAYIDNDFGGYEVNPTGSACQGVDIGQSRVLSIALCNGQTLSLGTGVVTDVEYGGGDTGGGNATVTYSYESLNTFDIS